MIEWVIYFSFNVLASITRLASFSASLPDSLANSGSLAYHVFMARNVLGYDLIPCSMDPLTGFFRTGLCDTCGDDRGMHTVCARMSDEFLRFSAERGNDLSTPAPEFSFPGLKAGDYWCLCMGRWIEAYHAGCAPQVKLESTHASVLEFIDLEVLKQHAVTNA